MIAVAVSTISGGVVAAAQCCGTGRAPSGDHGEQDHGSRPPRSITGGLATTLPTRHVASPCKERPAVIRPLCAPKKWGGGCEGKMNRHMLFSGTSEGRGGRGRGGEVGDAL